MLTHTRSRFAHLTTLILALLLMLTQAPGPALAESTAIARHIGYGVSVAPHINTSSRLLDDLGMDWVKVYDSSQLGNYPNQKALYR